MAGQRKRFKIFTAILLSIFFACLLFFILIRLPFVQTYLAKKLTEYLTEKTGYTFSVDQVEIIFFSDIRVKKLSVKEPSLDTVLSFSKADVNLSLLSLGSNTIKIKNIILDDFDLRLTKSDSGLTIKNLFKAFQGSESNNTKAPKLQKKWSFFIGNIQINNLHFLYQDKKNNNKLNLNIGKVEVKSDRNLLDKQIQLKKIKIFDGDIQFTKGFHKRDLTDTGSHNIHFLQNNLLVYDQLQVKNVRFRYYDETRKIDTSGMDYFHLDVSRINMLVTNGKIDHDTIFGDVQNLDCQEKCGLQVKQFKCKAKVSTSEVECKNLLIKTELSEIKDYLQLRYDSFPDFKDFIHKVRIKGELKNSKIALKDINYFAKGKLTKIDHNLIRLSGTVTGKVDNFKGKNIEANWGRNTSFSGSFSFQGLPDFSETFISLKTTKFTTDYVDLQRTYPHVKYPENLSRMGTMTYKGNFDGFIGDFVTDGELKSDLGVISGDLNFKVKGSDLPYYRGAIQTESFYLGKWFNKTELIGYVSISAEVEGKGLKMQDLNAQLKKGDVNFIDFKGYRYKDIKVNGAFEKSEFEGRLSFQDKNMDLDFQGLINLNDSLPRFQFKAVIDRADLFALNLYPKPLSICGRADIDFTGKNVDDLKGSIELTDFEIKANDTLLPFRKLIASSQLYPGGNRKISIQSGVVDGEINGKFKLAQIPALFKNYALYYSTNKQNERMDTLSPMDFSFRVVVFEPGELSKLLHPNFYLIRNSYLNGSFNSSNHKLQFELSVPEIQFSGITYNGVKLKYNSEDNAVEGNLLLKGLQGKTSKSPLVENIALSMNYNSERSAFAYALHAEQDSAKNSMNLSGLFSTDLKSIQTTLTNSSVELNKSLWKIKEGSEIYYSKKYLNTKNLILENQSRRLFITTTHPTDTSTNLEIDLSSIKVGDFSSLFDKSSNVYFGLADGSVEIRNLFSKPSYLGNLYISNLGVNKDTLGNLSLFSNIENLGKQIPVECKLIGKHNNIVLSGFYSPGKTDNKLRFEADIQKADIRIINNYLSAYVKRSKGFAKGKLRLDGTDKKPVLTGIMELEDCETTVGYLNTRYFLKKEKIIFKENEIRLDNVTLFDEQGNQAYAGGKISHSYLRQFKLDIYVQTDNFQFLKTTSKENNLFWGTAYASGVALFKGPIQDILIHVEARSNRGTTITVPVRSSAETTNYSFYSFFNPNDTIPATVVTKKKKANLKVELDIDMTPDADVNLILDPVAGDNLKVNGEGDIKLNVSTTGDFQIFGEYTIQNGNYFFTLPTLVNKSFRIDKGSRIVFGGDVFEANISADAIYSIRAAPFELIQDLISPTETDLIARARKRTPIELLLSLRGPLKAPVIGFDISIKDLDPDIQNLTDQKLVVLKGNLNELNKQVAALLLTGNFFPNTVGGTGNLVAQSASSTVSEFLSSQISKYLSSLIGNFVQGLDFIVRYKPYSATSTNPDGTNSNINGNEVYFGVKQQLLDDRIILNVGGNIDLSNQSISTNRFNGDFSIEYQVTKDGRVRLKAFNRSNVDQFNVGEQTTNIRTGAGISYREEFDNLADLRNQYRIRKEKRIEKRAIKSDNKRIKKIISKGLQEVVETKATDK